MKPRLVFLLLLLVLIPTASAVEVPRDFYTELVKGNIQGHSWTIIEGIDENVDTTEYVIWQESIAFVWPATALTMNVSSSSIQDNPGGTGSFNVTIHGLDGNYNIISEVITLNGQTPVGTSLKYLRINRMRVGRSGTATFNVGTIYIGTGIVTAGKPAVIYNEITPQHGVSSSATYTVPDGYTAYITYFGFGTDTTKVIELTLRSRCVDCPDNSWYVEYHNHYQTGQPPIYLSMPFPYNEHTDIKVQARNSVGQAFASINMFLMLIDNDYLHNSTLLWGDGAASEIVISGEPVNINIESSEVDLLSQIPLIWIVFVSIGTIFTAGQKMIPDRSIRNLSFPLGFISWIIAAYIWAIEYAGTGFFPIIWVHVIPMFLLMAWGLSDLGSSIGEKYE